MEMMLDLPVWHLGLVLLNVMTIIKALFSIGIGQDSSWSIMPSLAVGMVALNATVIVGAHLINRYRQQHAAYTTAAVHTPSQEH